MNTITVQKNGKTHTIEVPATWNELSAAQLLRIAKDWESWRMVAQNYPAGLNLYRIYLLFVLLDFKWYSVFTSRGRLINSLIPSRREWRKIGLDDDRLEQYEYLMELIKLSSFILDESCNLTKNLIPTIGYGKHQLHGPSELCASMKIKEFVFADTFFTAWQQSRNVEHLDTFITLIYRPTSTTSPLDASFTGDRRIEFNNMATDYWLPQVKRLPMPVKIAITLFYQGCRNNWEKLYSNLFQAAEDKSFKVQDWNLVLMELPTAKFGTLEERKNYFVDEIFTELNRILGEHADTKTGT